MANKKKGKRTKPTKKVAQQHNPQQQAIDAMQQQLIVGRLKKAFTALAAPPEGILDMLERLEIPYEERELTSLEDSKVIEQTMYVCIRLRDLVEGEKRNQLQGSIVKRLYGESAASVIPQATAPTEKIRPDSDEFTKLINDTNFC